jgi:hypothetical protein
MSNTITRREFDALSADVRALSASVQALVTALDPKAPAKADAPKAQARKPRAKKATPKPAPKGAQTRETLSRKDWNRTLTAKARLAGRYDTGDSVYAYVLANWDEAQQAREAGMTPDQFLAQF